MRLLISAALAAVVVSAMSGTLPASAQWWNPLAPSDFEECTERAAKEAKTSEALNILLESCRAKFAGRRKPGGGYTFLDARQNRSFPIAGPNPTPAETKYFDEQYSVFLKDQQAAATAYAERSKQLQQLEAERQRARQNELADLERRRQSALGRVRVISREFKCQSMWVGCPYYDVTVRVENQSNENISSVSVGWVFFPADGSDCPSVVDKRESARVSLRPRDNAVLHFKGDGGPSDSPEKTRYCITVTDVQIAP
jgi:hypothetical protein